MPDVPAIPTREGPGLYYVGVIDDLDVHFKQGYVFKGLVFDVSNLPEYFVPLAKVCGVS